MNEIKPFAGGAVTGILIWVIMTLCDAVDERILKYDSYLGMIACIAVPLILSVIYIIIYLKKKPPLINTFLWFAGFLSFGIILSFIICGMVDNRTYILSASCAGGCSFMCLNGIEYIIYAFFTVGGFLIISSIFHIIYAVIRYFSNKKEN